MFRKLTIATIPLFAIACSDEPGSITSTVYGEEFIEEGIPATVFEDGWSVTFDKFLISIGGVAAKAGEGAPEVGDPGFYLVDLAQPSGGEGYELSTYDAPGGTYDHYGYRIAPAGDATPINVNAADTAAMKAGGYSIWVKGRATKGAMTKTLDWAFTLKLAYAHCEGHQTVDGTNITMQSTIHADHLFYDDAVSEEPNVSFQLVADADGLGGAPADGTITLAELAATDIRAQTRYQVGSNRDPAGAAITNLKQYVEHQATTVGHINGEGHCADVLVTP